MANFFEYIDWRGDLDVKNVPLNEVDFAILSWMIYAPLDDYVTREFDKNSATVNEIGHEFLMSHDLEEILETSTSFTKTSMLTLKELGMSKRFGTLKVVGFEGHTSIEDEIQFAAVTFLTDDNSAVVTFRGTDDTLIGWKEDFNMSFTGEVPAQTRAVEYLERAAANVKGDIYVCGHSKGGNLAIYSVLKASKRIRNRVKAIYNFDGPGFGEMTDLGNAVNEVFAKTYTFVPEQSLVGMLLNHDENYIVVSSSGKLLMQHDLTTWQVFGPAFVRVEALKDSSRLLAETIKNWVSGLDDVEREVFVNALFEVLMSSSSKTLVEINEDVFGYAMNLVKSMTGLPKETKQFLQKIIQEFLKEGGESWKREVETKAAERKKNRQKVSKVLIDTK